MKTNLDKFFKTNSDLEKSGIDIEIAGVTFRCRRFSVTSPHVKSATLQYLKPVMRQVQTQTLPEEKSQELERKIFIQACLIGWSGLLDDKGVEIPFSMENAIELFTDMPELFTTLQDEASKVSNYMQEDVAELGND